MKILNLGSNTKKQDFYQTLRILYYFVDTESKKDTGEVLKKMNRTKKLIAELAADLGNLALLNNWYDISKIDTKKLIDLVNYDEETGYTAKINL